MTVNENSSKENIDNNLKEHHLTTKFFNNALNKELEVTFRDGEIISGILQWFDRWNLKITLTDGKECIIYRHAIKAFRNL